MKPYESIETVFTRDKTTNLLNFGVLRNPAHAIISHWDISEKIDGTNIRVIVTHGGIEVRGRTDKADLKADLVKNTLDLFDHSEVIGFFTGYHGIKLPEDWSVTFYGEGYGAGIQKGTEYSPLKRFRCFDLKLDGDLWLSDCEMRRICYQLSIPVAPLLWEGITSIPTSREELLSLVPYSRVAEEDRGAVNVMAEGIVAKPAVVLKDCWNNRVMWKLTFREFKKN